MILADAVYSIGHCEESCDVIVNFAAVVIGGLNAREGRRIYGYLQVYKKVQLVKQFHYLSTCWVIG